MHVYVITPEFLSILKTIDPNKKKIEYEIGKVQAARSSNLCKGDPITENVAVKSMKPKIINIILIVVKPIFLNNKYLYIKYDIATDGMEYKKPTKNNSP